ncbi:hypothetical protein [Scytonema millei]|uniref:Phosphohydrolase n=1 Tax=Scytonema millei VB511283 TaxID=1245923 RepID=A0A9X5E8F0_9CYAN|nr:hypothetical protein [Scytonema millei]NHC37280.1 phosphohydrolase [Scytonema millei VB511283]
MNQKIITECHLIDDILEPRRETFSSKSDFVGYRNHCLRMLNFVLCLSKPEVDREEKIAIATALHDLTIFPDRTVAYLEPAVELAELYLTSINRQEWSAEIAAMIRNHHKIRTYKGEFANLVESMRQADWIDVSFGKLRFGLPKSYVREVHQAFPTYSFYPSAIAKVLGSYAIKHPLNPLPILRW